MSPASVAPVAAAIIRRKRRKIYQAFRTNAALSPNSAKSLAELKIDRNRFFDSFLQHEVIKTTPHGKYFLDEQRLTEFHRQRHRLLIVPIIALVLAVVLLIWWITAQY
jgi:hypothetical protein